MCVGVDAMHVSENVLLLILLNQENLVKISTLIWMSLSWMPFIFCSHFLIFIIRYDCWSVILRCVLGWYVCMSCVCVLSKSNSVLQYVFNCFCCLWVQVCDEWVGVRILSSFMWTTDRYITSPLFAFSLSPTCDLFLWMITLCLLLHSFLLPSLEPRCLPVESKNRETHTVCAESVWIRSFPLLLLFSSSNSLSQGFSRHIYSLIPKSPALLTLLNRLLLVQSGREQKENERTERKMMLVNRCRILYIETERNSRQSRSERKTKWKEIILEKFSYSFFSKKERLKHMAK